MKEIMQEFIIKAGTIIKIKGLPFKLEQDTKVSGTTQNYKLVSNQSEQSLSKPNQAGLQSLT